MDAPYEILTAGTRPARFWANVDNSAPDECWPWQRAVNGSGYGVHRCGSDGASWTTMAHRVAWILTNERPIPEGLYIDHLCRCRRCCNPTHLRDVNNSQNVRASSWYRAGESPVVRTGPPTIRQRGARHMVIWREYLEDGNVRQTGRTFLGRAAAEAFASTLGS